jgi:hypothetical protein
MALRAVGIYSGFLSAHIKCEGFLIQPNEALLIKVEKLNIPSFSKETENRPNLVRIPLFGGLPSK